MTAFLRIPSMGGLGLALVRRVAKAAAEIVELFEIAEGDANVAALAAGMTNCDFCPERESEFVLKRKRAGVDGRGRPSRGRRAEMSSWCAAARAARRAKADAGAQSRPDYELSTP